MNTLNSITLNMVFMGYKDVLSRGDTDLANKFLRKALSQRDDVAAVGYVLTHVDCRNEKDL